MFFFVAVVLLYTNIHMYIRRVSILCDRIAFMGIVNINLFICSHNRLYLANISYVRRIKANELNFDTFIA